MKAPEKIYLHKIRDEEQSGYFTQWFSSRARCVPSEEYIRKDVVEHIIRAALGPQDALNKIRSL